MITGVIKNKVDKIWTDIWAGGITNPLTVIEQLTYLMFIRTLDEKELENEELDNVICIDGFELVPHDEKCFGDLYLHPNEDGFKYYFENLYKIIKEYI